MIVGEEEIEWEVRTQRGALHFEVRMSRVGCQYTNTHSHREQGTNATEDEYGHKEKR